MRIELEFKGPKFREGDIIERRNKNNNKTCFMQIISYTCQYKFDRINDKVNPNYECINACYNVSVQMGSYHDNEKATPFRQGTTLTLGSELELESELVKDYKYLITSPDTDLNKLKEREKEWQKLKENSWILLNKGFPEPEFQCDMLPYTLSEVERNTTHKLLSLEEHRDFCPRWNIKNKTGEKYDNTMTCEGCLITELIWSNIGGTKGYCQVCYLDKLDKK